MPIPLPQISKFLTVAATQFSNCSCWLDLSESENWKQKFKMETILVICYSCFYLPSILTHLWNLMRSMMTGNDLVWTTIRKQWRFFFLSNNSQSIHGCVNIHTPREGKNKILISGFLRIYVKSHFDMMQHFCFIPCVWFVESSTILQWLGNHWHCEIHCFERKYEHDISHPVFLYVRLSVKLGIAYKAIRCL